MSELVSREPIPTTSTEWASPVTLADLVGELVKDAEDALQAASEGRARGPITGLQELDGALGGFLVPGLHVLTGNPGTGKTALALQAAANCGCPALFVTAEQAPRELFRRHIARVTETRLSDLRGVVPVKVRELANRAAAAAPMLTLLDATQRPAPREQIEALVAGLRSRFKSRDVLIVIDALQPWAKGLGAGAGAEYELIQAGLHDLVATTSALRVPALVLSHRNRESAKAKALTGAMTAAKGSSDFEHLAETVVRLSWASGDDFNADERRVTVELAKNRHGPAAFDETLHFHGDLSRFRGARRF